MSVQERVPLIVGAVIAVICQVMLAPNMHVLAAAPNFVLAYVIAVAVANARGGSYIMAFLVGLAFDLSSTGPVGSMAFVCVATMLLSSLAFRALDNETPFVPIVIIICASFLSEMMYGLLMIACGVDVSLLDALVFVALPCGLYDTVIALLAYALVLRFVFKDRRASEMKIIDTSVE